VKIAKRICPLFELSPEAFDQSSSNCGSCKHYDQEYRPWLESPCKKHESLLEWTKTPFIIGEDS